MLRLFRQHDSGWVLRGHNLDKLIIAGQISSRRSPRTGSSIGRPWTPRMSSVSWRANRSRKRAFVGVLSVCRIECFGDLVCRFLLHASESCLPFSCALSTSRRPHNVSSMPNIKFQNKNKDVRRDGTHLRHEKTTCGETRAAALENTIKKKRMKPNICC